MAHKLAPENGFTLETPLKGTTAQKQNVSDPLSYRHVRFIESMGYSWIVDQVFERAENSRKREFFVGCGVCPQTQSASWPNLTEPKMGYANLDSRGVCYFSGMRRYRIAEHLKV